MAWTKLADLLGTARTSAIGFSIGTTGYVGLGTLSTGGKANDFWAYNSVNNTWSQKANFPGAGRYGAVGFSIGNKGYVGLGADSTTGYNDFYEYDPATNIWTKKVDFPAEARLLCVGFGIGAFGYIGLGKLKFNDSRRGDFWKFDPTGSGAWALITTYGNSASTALVGSVSFVINSKAYIGLGNTINGRVSYIYEFNPVGNVWTAKDSFGGGARDYAIAFSTTGNKGYVGLGYGDVALAGYKSDLWEFDPAAGVGSQWTKVSDFIGVARYAATGFGIGANGYVGAGGTGSILLKDFYKFDPTTLASVTQTLSLKWRILKASIPKNIVLKWDILDKSPVSKNLILKWNIANYIFIPDVDCVLKWDIYKAAERNLTLNWKIEDKVSVSANRILKWDIRKYVSDDLVCKWDIEDKVFIDPATLELQWNILSPIQKSINFKWDIAGLREIQDKALICKWNIGAYVQKDLINVWDIRDLVDIYPILILKWDIGTSSDVTQTLQLKWNIGEYVSKNLVCKWDIFGITGATGYISDTCVLKWNLNGRTDITKQIVLKWNISATTISKDFIFKWGIENNVKKNIVFKWDIASMGKPRYEFESEERNKTFRRELIRRKQLTTTN